MTVFIYMPESMKNLYNLWKIERQRWLTRGQKIRSHYNNDVEQTHTTFTQQQTQNIEQATNIPVNINYQFPIVQTSLAIITENRPGTRIINIDEGKAYREFAFALDKAKQGVMYNSQALRQLRFMAKSMLTFGIGSIGIVDEEYYYEGDFPICMKYIPQENLIFDPNMEDPDINRSQGYWYEKELTETEIQRRFGKKIIEINRAYKEQNPQGIDITLDFFMSSTSQVDENVQKIVPDVMKKGHLRVYYDKVFTTGYYVTSPTGDTELIFKENMTEIQWMILTNNEENIFDKEENIYVRETTVLGDYVIDVSIIPQTVYNVENYYFEWNDKIYQSYGLLNWTQGINEAIDKLVQIMILNGILTNTPSWIAPNNSIDQTERTNWEKYGGDPRRVKFYKPIVIENQVLKPERESVGQLSNFYPMMIQMLVEASQFVSGVNAILRGDSKDANIEVFASLQTYQTAAMQRIMMQLGEISVGMTSLGQIIIQKLITNLKPNLMYRFFDEDKQEATIKFTRGMLKKIRLGKFKVSAIPAQMLQTQKNTIATELFKVAQSTEDSAQRTIFMNKGFQMLGIKELDDLLEETDVAKRLQQTIGQMQQALKEGEEVQKQFRNRTLYAEMKSELLTRLNDVLTKIAKAETNAIAQIEIDKLNAEIKRLQKPEKSEA